MITTRLVTQSDVPMLTRWWEAAEMYGFTGDYLPRDTAYMTLSDGEPAAVLCIYKTNIKEYAYLECYIANPDMEKSERRLASEHLVKYAEKQAVLMGYKKLVCLTHIDALKARYEELGYKPSLQNVTTFVKEL